MKVRILSAIIMIAIVVPLLIIGGIPYTIGVWIIAMMGLKEFMDMKNSEQPLPFIIQILSYLLLTLIMFSNYQSNTVLYTIDLRILAGLFITFLLPTVLYHDKKKYSIVDAFYIIGGILFLGIAMSLLLLVRNMGLPILFYLILITTMTDTYSYVTGILIGKHKLLPQVSPKKTWEGSIGGTIFGVFISSIFYITVIDTNISLGVIIPITLFLSCIGQFGDLIFSMIKRHYNKKDFSNLIPGHGGILDRLDSLIFVLLGFMFFVSYI